MSRDYSRDGLGCVWVCGGGLRGSHGAIVPGKVFTGLYIGQRLRYIHKSFHAEAGLREGGSQRGLPEQISGGEYMAVSCQGISRPGGGGKSIGCYSSISGRLGRVAALAYGRRKVWCQRRGLMKGHTFSFHVSCVESMVVLWLCFPAPL